MCLNGFPTAAAALLPHLLQPHGGEDEEQLDEDSTKGQHAANKARKHGVHVPGLLRDLAGDLVGAHRVLWSGLLVAKVGAHKHKGHRDAEPQEAKCKQSAERHSTR